MLAKLTAKNQLTLPKAVVSAIGHCEYFDVTVEHGRIVLTPVRLDDARGVREKLAAVGIADGDVAAAIEWAREGEQPHHA